MKKLFTSMFAMATLLTASAQMASGVQARVYAYNLQQNQTTLDDGVNTYTITFQTNCAASEGAKVYLLNEDGETVYEVAATAIDNTQKSWSATVDVYVLQDMGYTPEAGDYNWSVEVSAPAVESLTELHDTNSADFFVYRSFGVCVDKSPESEYFGRAYVVNQYAWSGTFTATRTRNVSCGMYAYSADLTPENDGNAYTCDILSGETISGTSPADMCISEDGRLFVAVTDATKYGVYYINPKDFSYSNVFAGTTINTDIYGATALFDADNNRITSLRSGITTMGYGENTTLMVSETIDLFYTANTDENDKNLSLYTCPMNFFEIGTDNTWNSVPSYTLAKTSSSLKTSGGANVVLNRGITSFDGTKNGFWAVQSNRRFASTSSKVNSVTNSTYTMSATNPYLFYYSNKTGKVESTDFDNLPNASPALAVNDELGLVAYTLSGTANPIVKKYTENEDGTISIIATVSDYDLKSQMGNKADAMDFDYAGNLYAVTSGSEKFRVYALPDALVGENKRVTPAKSNLLISLTENDITTGIVEVGVDADAAVEYYNLQGVKVENPSNGIFIKKQGNKTTKVVL